MTQLMRLYRKCRVYSQSSVEAESRSAEISLAETQKPGPPVHTHPFCVHVCVFEIGQGQGVPDKDYLCPLRGQFRFKCLETDIQVRTTFQERRKHYSPLWGR